MLTVGGLKALPISLVDTKDTLWWSDTVIISTDISIPAGTTLIIQPSARITFTGMYYLLVHGQIIASATPGEPITFIGDSVGGIGAGGGIRLEPSASLDTSVFEHCHFIHCGSGPDCRNDGMGALSTSGRWHTMISECIFLDNLAQSGGGAVHADSAGITIRLTHFEGNRSGMYGGAVEITGGPGGRIQDCTFLGNMAELSGGGISARNEPAWIEGNVFLNNFATDTVGPGITQGNGGGIHLSFPSGGMTVFRNVLENNRSNSGLYESTLASMVANNLIVSNAGAGIINGHNFSESIYLNNTIAFNENAGIAVNSPLLTIANNIIWHNGTMLPENQLFVVVDTPLVMHCCISGGYYPAYGNNVIQADPMFVLPAMTPGTYGFNLAYDYRLQGASSCIDAGTALPPGISVPATDLTGAPRVAGTQVDIGAYESSGTSLAYAQETATGLRVLPNPTRDEFRILSEERIIRGRCQLSDLTGKLIMEREFTVGERISTEGLPAGIYICTIKSAPGNCASIKLIKIQH